MALLLEREGAASRQEVSWNELSAEEQGAYRQRYPELAQALQEGWRFLAELAGAGSATGSESLRLAVPLGPDGQVGPVAALATRQGKDYPAGTLIVPGAKEGLPFKFEPLFPSDKIGPVLAGERLTWAIWPGGRQDRAVAVLDENNRWSTRNRLCDEFWQEQTLKMGLDVSRLDRSDRREISDDFFYSLEYWLQDQEQIKSWDQIPEGWRWQRLGDETELKVAGQEGTLALVVAPGGEVYRAYWDPKWGKKFGFVDEDGQPVEPLSPLPQNCLDEQGRLRPGLRFQLEQEGGQEAIKLDLGEVIYTYSPAQKAWQAEKRPQPEGMLDLEGLEEQYNPKTKRWEYRDSQGQEIAYWDRTNERIQIVAERLKPKEYPGLFRGVTRAEALQLLQAPYNKERMMLWFNPLKTEEVAVLCRNTCGGMGIKIHLEPDEKLVVYTGRPEGYIIRVSEDKHPPVVWTSHPMDDYAIGIHGKPAKVNTVLLRRKVTLGQWLTIFTEANNEDVVPEANDPKIVRRNRGRYQFMIGNGYPGGMSFDSATAIDEKGRLIYLLDSEILGR